MPEPGINKGYSVSADFHPLVSIIIPVYNGSNYMREAIDSALAQSYDNIEVIVVNDGSVDDTAEIAKSYGKAIRYYEKENGGVASALNLAIEEAKGDYISWLSHDDMYSKDKLEKQIFRLSELNGEKRANTILWSNYQLIDEASEVTRTQHFHDAHSSNLLNHQLYPILNGLVHGCTLLLPKHCFKNVGYFNTKLKTTQDYDLWFRMFPKYDLIFSDDVFVLSRWHDEQGSKSIAEGEREADELWIRMIEGLTDQQKIEMFESVGRFHEKVLATVEGANYVGAAIYLRRLINRDSHYTLYSKSISVRGDFLSFDNLQISDNDIIGNKFNGHDLHISLRERGLDSRQLVWNQKSKDLDTLKIGRNQLNCTKLYIQLKKVREEYSLNGILNPLMYDILYDPLFLNAETVHLHLVHNELIDLQLLPVMSKLKPIVWTLHDPWALGGHCIHHYDCDKWMEHCGDCPHLDVPFQIKKDNSALNFRLKKDAISASDFSVIVASKWMEKKVTLSPIFNGKKVYVVPFGLDQSVFRPYNKVEVRKNLGISTDALVIAFRCDYSQFKGMATIEHTLKGLTSNKPIVLLLLQGELKMVPNSGIDVIEYGWVKDDKLLAQIYSASDLFLMPSSVESFGMMAIEAMSCETLPIVWDGTALPEIVNSPECGVATERSKESYLAVVQHYIDNENERETRSKMCLAYAEKSYGKKLYIDRMIEVYNKAVSEHAQSQEDHYLLAQLKTYMMSQTSLKKSLANNVSGPPNIMVRSLKKMIPKKMRSVINRVLGRRQAQRKAT